MEMLTCYVLLKTKIDSSFRTGQFSLERYHSPYHLNVSNRTVGLLVYVNVSIPTQQLKYVIKYRDIQINPFEINLSKEKQPVESFYRPLYKTVNIFEMPLQI